MFHLKQNNTSVRTEMIAGLTTFLTMAYVMVVNPLILSEAGISFDQSFSATIIATLTGTLFMGLLANYPIAVAPGMGLNAYFAFSVVQANEGMNYQVAFSAVFVAGIIFVILSLTPLRSKLIDIIPPNLKHAISAGIGLFIAFLGLKMSGIVAAHPTNLVTLGKLNSPGVVLSLIGLTVTLILFTLNIRGSLFLGMLITGTVALFTGQLQFTNGFVAVPSLPEGLIISNPFHAIGDVIQYGLYAVVFSFLLVTIFDTTGTVVAVSEQAGLMKEGKLARARRVLLGDSVATMVGAMFGTSPSSAFLESASGVAAGGRTGLTSVVVAVLFAVSAFFSPLISSVSGVSAITAPALIIVGSLMLTHVRHIKWEPFDESFPAFFVILTMPVTGSIATGIAMGFITYPILKLARGKVKEIHPLICIIALMFLYQLIFLPH